MKKATNTFFSLMMAACLILPSTSLAASPVKGAETNTKTQLTEADLTAALAGDTTLVNDKSRVSVHDPSIVATTDDNGKDLYYIFGSHLGFAKSYDLMNWESISTTKEVADSLFGTFTEDGNIEKVHYNDAFVTSAFDGKVKTIIDGIETEVDFGSYNAKAWNTALANYNTDGNMWAPDVIYNKDSKKWCMYMTLNGYRQNSVIILLTADNIEGPYVYQGPVVYSGFATDTAALSYKNTDLELVYGELDTLPAKYNKAANGTWGNYWPHAIDACVFYDEEGKLRMTYGSWSGGIYQIELDENTGLRDYTVTYEDIANGQNITSDPYFGKHIAGGYYVSGEGAYIKYINDRYYLFVTNGDLGADGNYQMRVFSSKNPDGPFTDTNGQSAIYDAFKINFNANYGHIYTGSDNGAAGSTAGSRLMTNYKWEYMKNAEISQGHNSILVNDEGAFVIYHTRFDDTNILHQVRVHQLFNVGDGALVAAPCEYDANITDKASYTTTEVSGLYDVIFGKYDTNPHWIGGSAAEGGYLANPGSLDYESPEQMQFLEDGKIISGTEEIGFWSLKKDKKYATVSINEKIGDEHLIGTYDCIVTEQNVSGTKATCFTGMNLATGISIWGCINQNSDAKAIALTNENLEREIPYRTTQNLTLPTKGLSGAKISWESNAPDLLSNTGKLGKITEDTQVTLTETISRGNAYYQNTYKVIVSRQDLTKDNLTVTLPSKDYYNVQKNPFYGKKLNQLYIRYSLNWNEASALNGLAGLFSFCKSSKEANGQNGRIEFLSAPYICYNSQTGATMDVNSPAGNSLNVQAGKSYTYEILIDRKTDSIQMYKDGSEIALEGKLSSSTDVTPSSLLDYISTSCDTFSWGTGNTELCTLENVVISDKAYFANMTETEYTIGNSVAPTVMENPFAGKNIDLFELEFTASYPDADIDSFGGLLAFNKTAGYGRISFHAMPYLCYNDTNGNWIDLKAQRSYTLNGQTYQYKYVFTEDSASIYINGEQILTSKDGSGAAYKDVLSYISSCDVFNIGVTTANAFWGSVSNATISNIHMYANAYSMVIPPYKTIEEETPLPDNENENSNSGGTQIQPTPSDNPQPKPTVTVKVKKATLQSVKNTKGKKLTVKWKKISGVTGYEIQYSTSKKFAKSKTKTAKIKKASTTSKTIKKLKKGKKYYVKMRAYKKVNGKVYYGKYSNVKKITIRK